MEYPDMVYAYAALPWAEMLYNNAAEGNRDAGEPIARVLVCSLIPRTDEEIHEFMDAADVLAGVEGIDEEFGHWPMHQIAIALGPVVKYTLDIRAQLKKDDKIPSKDALRAFLLGGPVPWDTVPPSKP